MRKRGDDELLRKINAAKHVVVALHVGVGVGDYVAVAVAVGVVKVVDNVVTDVAFNFVVNVVVDAAADDDKVAVIAVMFTQMVPQIKIRSWSFRIRSLGKRYKSS